MEGEIADVMMLYSVVAVAGSRGPAPLRTPGGGTSELSEHRGRENRPLGH